MIWTAHLGGPGHLAEPTSRRARIRWRSRSESRASDADGKGCLEVEASRGPEADYLMEYLNPSRQGRHADQPQRPRKSSLPPWAISTAGR